MRQLGYVPCASAGTLTLNYDREGNVSDRKCSVCESGSPTSSVAANYDDTLAAEAIATFVKLIDLPDFEESRRPRVQAMLTLRHFALHFKDREFLDLETSKLGQWCLKSLRSSMRELRVTAGYELALFYSLYSLLTSLIDGLCHFSFEMTSKQKSSGRTKGTFWNFCASCLTSVRLI